MEMRTYGVATTLYFPLVDKGATDFESTPVPIATGDCMISKDGGAFANTGTNFSHVGGGIYKVPLTATEMQAKVIVVRIKDATATKEWEDQCIVITTIGNVNAEMAYLNSGVAESYGSLIYGLIDTEVAAIKAKTDNLPSDPADASDVAAATTAIAGYIDTEVAAIKAKTDLIPATPASTADIPSAAAIAAAVLMGEATDYEDTAAVNTLIGVILKLTGRFKALTGETFKQDGTTVFMTQTPIVDANADPITELGGAA